MCSLGIYNLATLSATNTYQGVRSVATVDGLLSGAFFYSHACRHGPGVVQQGVVRKRARREPLTKTKYTVSVRDSEGRQTKRRGKRFGGGQQDEQTRTRRRSAVAPKKLTALN